MKEYLVDHAAASDLDGRLLGSAALAAMARTILSQGMLTGTYERS